MTCTLCAHNWHALIDPERGGNLLSLRFGKREILRPWSEEISDPFLFGAPPLLPANRTAEGRFCFEGREYHLPVNDAFSNAHLHGRLHNRNFQLVQQKADFLTLDYVNQGEIYPFPFRISVTYRAEEQAFTAEYAIENLSDGSMPLTFGLHTTFPEPESFRVPLKSCQEKDARHIPTGRYIPLNEQEQRYCTGSASRNVTISGFYLAAESTAQVGDDLYYETSGFDHWVLYNGRGTGGFLCIEPQLGGVNALNDSRNCPILSEKETLHLKTRIRFRP